MSIQQDPIQEWAFLPGRASAQASSTALEKNNIVATNGCKYTAGVVGWAEEGSFSGIHTSGSISGNNVLGGIAGRTMDTTFKNCWNETNIDNEKATIRQSGRHCGHGQQRQFL